MVFYSGHVISENQAFPGDCEESIPRTRAWETVVWQNLFRWRYKLPPGFPMSHLPLSHQGKSGSGLESMSRETEPCQGQFSPIFLITQLSQLVFLAQFTAVLRYSGSCLEAACGVLWSLAMQLLRPHDYGERMRNCLGQVQATSKRQLLCSPGVTLT